MKKVTAILIACIFSICFLWITQGIADDKVDRILDLLKKKGIITEQEYREVKKEIEEEGKHDVVTTFDKGFKMRTRDRKFELGVGGRIQFDFRGYNAGHPEDNEFDVRRIRIFLKGRLYEHFLFKTQLELEGGKVGNRLRDGYLEYDYFKKAKLRMGQFKEPFGLEELTTSKHILFLERSLNNALVPSRDMGIMLHGNLNSRINYAIGIFNGNGVDSEGEDNDDKEVAMRAVISPFEKNRFFLGGLHIGSSFTYGHEDEETLSARSEARTKYFEFKDVDTDTRTRFGGDINWTIGPFMLNAEYIRAKYDDFKGKAGRREVKDSGNIDSWYVAAAYCITGEGRGYKNGVFTNITPKNNFDLQRGTWGAWEMAFRYSHFSADRAFFKSGIVKPDYSRKADSYALGINWFLNPSMMVKVNYVHTDFEHDFISSNKRLKDEDVFLARFQLVY